MTREHKKECYVLAIKILSDYYEPIALTRAQELADLISKTVDDYLTGEGKDEPPTR